MSGVEEACGWQTDKEVSASGEGVDEDSERGEVAVAEEKVVSAEKANEESCADLFAAFDRNEKEIAAETVPEPDKSDEKRLGVVVETMPVGEGSIFGLQGFTGR
jgi:hypothetical protein